MDDVRSSIAIAGRRLARACARCKKRKTRCDFGYPSCGACTKAGAVCRAYSSSGGQDDLPRSLVRALEAKVAELERKASGLQQSPTHIAEALTSKLAQSTLSCGVSCNQSFLTSPDSLSFFVHSCCLPLLVPRSEFCTRRNSDARGEKEWSAPSSRWPSLTDLTKIPDIALDQIMWNYTNIHLPQYPIFQKDWLSQILTQARKGRSSHTDGGFSDTTPSSFDYFVIFGVLAISSLTLTWKNEHQARSASDGFFSSALKHLQRARDLAPVQRLQTWLLLAHYAHMNPGKVDNWVCIWNATRIILELGYHKVSPQQRDQNQTQFRSELFWALYGMERCLACTVRLPLAFSEESITVPRMPVILPCDNEKQASQPSSAAHLYHLRQIETDIHRRLYLLDDTGQEDGHDLSRWVKETTQRLDEWLEKAKEYSKHQMLEFRQVNSGIVKLRLLRPTPRLRTRTSEERQICFDAGSKVVDDYLRQAKRKRLFYSWHAVHILFETALVLLDASWRCRDDETLKHQARHTLSVTVPDCLVILRMIGELWVEAGSCVKFLAPVVQEVTQAFNRRIFMETDAGQEVADAAVSRTLDRLLFPSETQTLQGAFAQQRTPVVAHSQSVGFVNDVADASLPSLDSFDWDAEWNLLQDLSPVWNDHSPMMLGDNLS